MAVRWAALLVLAAAGIVLAAFGVARLISPNGPRWHGAVQILTGSIVPVLVWLIRPVFLGWVGDAARYFSTTPDTPVERQQIRAQGVALLNRLHHQLDSNGTLEYGRIIVVGHSLGSVIAYDVLSTYWAQVNFDALIPKASAALHDIEALTKSDPPVEESAWSTPSDTPKGMTYADEQTALIEELRPEVWRITDLVTLGSPLTHARFLIGRNSKDLCNRVVQRELPTCPPVRDEVADETGRKSFVFCYEPVTGADHVAAHHAAPFLLTRWTNLYLPHDPIGGPLRPLFGWGIRDVQLDAKDKLPQHSFDAKAWLLWVLNLFGGAHIRYWDLENDDPKRPYSPCCSEVLRAIVKDPRPWLDKENG